VGNAVKRRGGGNSLDEAYLLPVSQPGVGSLLFPEPAVNSEDGAPSLLEHLGVIDGFLNLREHPDLAGHWDLEVLVKVADNPGNQVPLILEERAIVAPLGNVLGATKVQVHRIALVLHMLGSLKDCLGIISTELKKVGDRRFRWKAIERKGSSEGHQT